MPDAGFANSSGAKGGLVPLLLVTGVVVAAFVVFVVTVVLQS
jgi:hypothetical protein